MKKFILAAIVLFSATFTNQLAAQSDAEVVKLVQVEKEFTTKKMTLKAGDYIFEVMNDGVDRDVAFVLSPKGKTGEADHIKEAYLVKTVNDGESAQSNVVTLAKGEYSYFCPMNPTPIYTLTVK